MSRSKSLMSRPALVCVDEPDRAETGKLKSQENEIDIIDIVEQRLTHFRDASASVLICLFAAASSKAMRLVAQTTVVELILCIAFELQ